MELSPEPPKGLNADARDAWVLAVANAPKGWLTVLDCAVLENWARNYAMVRRMRSKIEHEGYTKLSEKGVEVPHPLLGPLFKALAALASAEKELGFTPASRARVRDGVRAPEEGSSNPFIDG